MGFTTTLTTPSTMTAASTVTKQLPCERIGYGGDYEPLFNDFLKTCWMEKTTQINQPETTINSGRDESVAGIWFRLNKKIFFLPEKVDEIFPNLIGYVAEYCSIIEVSKKNFRNLFKLRGLWLQGNQIEVINSDTFEDLTSLERLYLNTNKIKSLNGKAFMLLRHLKTVGLNSNLCIDEQFNSPEKILHLKQIVNEQCADHQDLKESLSKILKEQVGDVLIRIEEQLKQLDADVSQLNSKFSQAQCQIDVKSQQITALEEKVQILSLNQN